MCSCSGRAGAYRLALIRREMEMVMKVLSRVVGFIGLMVVMSNVHAGLVLNQYRVQTGDNLYKVARILDLTFEQLCNYNEAVCNQQWLYTGQLLKGQHSHYVVDAGSLEGYALVAQVATLLEVSVGQLYQVNNALLLNRGGGLLNGDVLYASEGGNASELSPPERSTLTLDLSQPKTFVFSWSEGSNATLYQLFEDIDGVGDFSLFNEAMTSGTVVWRRVPLYQKAAASYVLRSCHLTVCVDSNVIDITDKIVNSIGYFKASNTTAYSVIWYGREPKWGWLNLGRGGTT